MARRSDHTPDELRELLVSQGHRLLAETGFARFSGREAAKRAGYSVGTIYNVFGSLDGYITALNTRTFANWADHLRMKLSQVEAQDDRIAALVSGYFDFATTHANLWTAIYDHRLPPGTDITEADRAMRSELTKIVAREIASAVGGLDDDALGTLTRSLIATVHGHCSFMVTGSFALMQERDPEGSALARVRESLAAAACPKTR